MGGYVRGQGALYLTVSRGKLRNKKEQIELDGWEGELKAIDKAEDDYEGQVRLRYQLTLQDADGKVAKIQFTDETWYCVGLFARLAKIDLNKPVLVGALPSEQNDKMSFCWMRQGETKITPVEDFPKPHKVVVGRKEAYDYTEVNSRIDSILADLAGKGIQLTGLIEPLSFGVQSSGIQLDPAATVVAKEDLPF